MLAIDALSADATAFLYVAAFLVLTCAAIVAWASRAVVAALVATGLALTTLVVAWDSIATAGW